MILRLIPSAYPDSYYTFRFKFKLLRYLIIDALILIVIFE